MSIANHKDIKPSEASLYDPEALRLEVITTCVGFDDLLDYTLSLNQRHADHYIVVTSHADQGTQWVARRHGARCGGTDLFEKDGCDFNKGAALNAGFNFFRYRGWQLHLDADIVLPDNFRRVLSNLEHLERDCLYGCERLDMGRNTGTHSLQQHWNDNPQHGLRFLVDQTHDRELPHVLGGRMVGDADGYTPPGFFQLWHASRRQRHPCSTGDAAEDARMFSRLWPVGKRRRLPACVVYHLGPTPRPAPLKWGEN
jgi:hypothetical protein